MPCMTRAEIDAAVADALQEEGTPLERARRAMQHAGCGSPGQQMGSRWPMRWSAVKAWQMRAGLAAGRGEVRTLSFLIHGFMDAGALERERIDACVFKTMTAEGPVSMCLHNAKRDSFILQPLGEAPQRYGLKHAKGRARQNLLKQRALS